MTRTRSSRTASIRRGSLMAFVAATSLVGVARATDEVVYWNNVLLDEFRTNFGTGCPCPLSRAGAMTQLAVFEAVNSIARQYHPYLAFLDAPSTASKEAAAAAAAHGMMVSLFPATAASLDAKYAARLALILNSQAKTDGIAVGQAAAAACIVLRTNDGSQNVETYTFGSNPGDYIPTPPGFSGLCNPEWKDVTPFCMSSGTQFRLTGPLGFSVMSDLLASPGYAAELNEVKDVGARVSGSRTDEQTRIAYFWANDVNGTYKSPGHLFYITQVVSADHSLTLIQNSRLFALVALAMGDAGIAAWDMKYATDIDLWRPVSAIRAADTDGNPLTDADPSWLPLNAFSPPFPAYVSGHAMFGAAHAGVMAEFFGTDNVTFTVDSEDPYYNALPTNGPRTFTKFSDAAWENSISRLYLGVHFRFDAADGYIAGLALGHEVGQNFLTPLCRSDYNHDAFVTGEDFDAFVVDFEVGSLAADFDGNGFLTGEDFDAFVLAFEGGC